MLNSIAKCLLVSTSLSPVLGAMAVSQCASGKAWTTWIWWLVGTLFLLFLCRAMLRYAEKNIQKNTLVIQAFERKDQEALTFLFIYLLPFLRPSGSTFASEWLTTGYILVIIILAIAHVGAFHFNPAMRLFGYRFYAVKTKHGVHNLLISKKNLRRPGQEVETVGLDWNVYLHTGDSDA